MVLIGLGVIVGCLLVACESSESARATQTSSAATELAAQWSLTPSQTATLTPSLTVTQTATRTPTPTLTMTPTVTLTPTYAFPEVVVSVGAAHCRYGPSTAFLHAADLYEGDRGVVHGRFPYSNWLWVRWDKLHYHCWVSPSVVDLTGDISVIRYQELNLGSVGTFDLYTPARDIRASRKGDEVTITWNRVPMTEDDDRGYLIIAWVCQDGAYLWWTQSFPDQYTTKATIKDDDSCSQSSSGVLYTVEKHGYSEPVTIPWPSH